MRDLLRRLNIILRQPWWQGVAATLTGLTLLAPIPVAVAVSCYVQQEEERRHEESRANFSTSIGIIRPDDADGHWFVQLGVTSNGPSTAHGVKIVLKAGNWGIEPLHPASASRGVLGDSITISQEFAAEEWRDSELREDPSLYLGPVDWKGVADPGKLRAGLITVSSPGQPYPILTKAFLSSLDVVGENVDFPEWRSEASCE
jgi:hypothetical protein